MLGTVPGSGKSQPGSAFLVNILYIFHTKLARRKATHIKSNKVVIYMFIYVTISIKLNTIFYPIIVFIIKLFLLKFRFIGQKNIFKKQSFSSNHSPSHLGCNQGVTHLKWTVHRTVCVDFCSASLPLVQFNKYKFQDTSYNRPIYI